MPTSSLPELKLQFLEHLEIERNVSQLTIRNYSHYLDRFLGFLDKRYPGMVEASQVDDEVIRNYRLCHCVLNRVCGASHYAIESALSDALQL